MSYLRKMISSPKTNFLLILEKNFPESHRFMTRFSHLTKELVWRIFGKKSGVLLYIGVNSGNLLETIAHKYSRVIAVEANPELYGELKQRFRIYRNVEIFSFAASDNDGEGNLTIPDNSTKFVSATLDNFTGARDWKTIRVIPVKTRNLGNFLKELGIERIDFYLSDCEGYDLVILKSCKYFLENKLFDRIQVEVQVNETPEIYMNVSNKEHLFDSLLSNNYVKTARGLGILDSGNSNVIPKGHSFLDVMYTSRK